MTLFLDSADRAELEPLLATGLFGGVTTNPLLLARAGLTPSDVPALHDWLVAAGARTVFAQTLGTHVDEIVADGRRLRGLGDRVVVKIPATRAGLAATRRLADEGVPLLVTAVHHAAQALLAAAAGARYVAPYLGRMTAAGRDGPAHVIAMQQILTGTETEVLAASVKSVDDLAQLAAGGVPMFTVGAGLAAAMLDEQLTDSAAAEFERVASGRATHRG